MNARERFPRLAELADYPGGPEINEALDLIDSLEDRFEKLALYVIEQANPGIDMDLVRAARQTGPRPTPFEQATVDAWAAAAAAAHDRRDGAYTIMADGIERADRIDQQLRRADDGGRGAWVGFDS